MGIPGQEGFEVICDRGFRQFGEQVREVRVRLDAARLGGLDERVQARAGRRADDCLAKEPVFSFMNGRP